MPLNQNRKIIIVHSYKGGTGKTSVVINLGRYLAVEHNKKVLLVEQDTRGASFSNIFKVTPNSYWNDFYTSGLELKQLIIKMDDLDIICARTEELKLPFDQTPEAFHTRQLERLTLQKKWLRATYDYVILDTHPGYSFELLNSIFIADSAILLTRLDVDTINRTVDMYQQIYARFTGKEIILVQNQVPILSLKHDKYSELDIDVEKALASWQEFIQDKTLITIPLEIKIAYRLSRSKLVPMDHQFIKYIHEIAELL